MENWKNEIIATEKAFCEMAKTEGIAKAFTHFAAEKAVLLRNEKLVKGKSAIKKLYEKAGLEQATLDWEPDFVDVSNSGDMAYTFGKYTLTTTDSSGHQTTSEGVFHTVWKRQPGGQWKFVWD